MNLRVNLNIFKAMEVLRMKRIDEEDSKSSILDGTNMKSLLINESGL